jgi:D-alanine-D-alanine ligase
MNFHTIRSDLPVLLLHYIDHQWLSDEINTSLDTAQQLHTALIENGHPVTRVCLESTDLASQLRQYHPDEYLIFNWCEELPSIPHSSALVAQILEELGFTFTGADSQSLTFSQDKRLVKERLHLHRLPTPQWQVYLSEDVNGWDCFPAIVKPAFEHSSYGITRDAVVQSPEELAERVQYIVKTFGQPTIVEEFIDGPEFHVTVLGNGVVQALPPVEIDFSVFRDVKDRLCTYESKFDPQSVSYKLVEPRLPAQLTEDELGTLKDIAEAAYRVTGCRDYARLDIRMRDSIFYILDVNHNANNGPDTSMSMAAEAVGLSYGRFSSLLVNLAARRHPIFGL